MYTVLLTDDEVSITDSIKSSIPWASLGIEKIYTAADGIQALELFQSHRIDLLITDIKMPRMDGLTLLTKVRESYPETHCILLTAYGEFEYARNAFRLGVENYLLKPLHIKEITETIEHAIDNMYAKRKNHEILFRENILRRWLSGTISGNELGERASILDINIYQPAFCVVSMRKFNNSVSLSAYGEECIKILSTSFTCLPVWDNQGRYLIIAGGSAISHNLLSDTFLSVAARMWLSDKISIAIGNIVFRSEDLPISYQNACRMIGEDDGTAPDPIKTCITDSTVSASFIPDIDYQNLSPIIQKALDYIQKGYADNISIKDFCASYTITTAYIGYMFKKETDIFFNNYLNHYRIGKAIEMLISTSVKINEIAAKNGFNTTSYFISSFKKHTGISPQKYREQHLNEIKK